MIIQNWSPSRVPVLYLKSTRDFSVLESNIVATFTDNTVIVVVDKINKESTISATSDNQSSSQLNKKMDDEIKSIHINFINIIYSGINQSLVNTT